jgi:hypothetical protein
VFFAIRLVIEAFLNLTTGFHAKVTPGSHGMCRIEQLDHLPELPAGCLPWPKM